MCIRDRLYGLLYGLLYGNINCYMQKLQRQRDTLIIRCKTPTGVSLATGRQAAGRQYGAVEAPLDLLCCRDGRLDTVWTVVGRLDDHLDGRLDGHPDGRPDGPPDGAVLTAIRTAVKTAVSTVSTAVLTAESFVQLTESSVQLMDPRPKLCSIEINYVQLKRRPASVSTEHNLFQLNIA